MEDDYGEIEHVEPRPFSLADLDDDDNELLLVERRLTTSSSYEVHFKYFITKNAFKRVYSFAFGLH